MLSTSGELTAGETEELEDHIVVCDECRRALPEYQEFVVAGMACIASGLNDPACMNQRPEAEGDAKRKLFARLRKRDPVAKLRIPPFLVHQKWIALPALAIALTAVGAYRLGTQRATPQNTSVATAHDLLSDELKSLTAEKNKLDEQLYLQSRSLDDLAARANERNRELTRLKELDKVRDAQYDSVVAKDQQQSQIIGSLSAERDLLAGKLLKTQESLQDVADNLASVREQHQKDSVRSASLEGQIRDLTERLRGQGQTIDQQQTFLASDRDIRELMGARQLYITDVFDADRNGTKRKPFGRIFYTKGKSLVFYAFDLDQQPKGRKATAFQAWGTPGDDRSKAVSLGVFYVDNESNRRWVLKSDDPVVLAGINAVFVTVEPKGESRTPSGKPFLFAYLRSARANHP